MSTDADIARPQDTSVRIIDADVHNTVGDLTPYLPKVWHERWQRAGLGVGAIHYGNPRGVARRDADPPDGGTPASDPAFLVEDHVRRHAIDYVIFTGAHVIPMGPDPDYGNALAAAHNNCLAEEWLPLSEQFRGSILVNSEDPPAAAAEIRRMGTHPDMVQALMCGPSRAPYGQRQYHPIYEAAVEVGIPVAIHPGTEGSGLAWQPTPVGYPTRYMEWHNILPITFMSQINSLVCEGVFERFPTLTFIGIEGGIGWLVHLMWRMDKNFKALRDTTPWLKRLPSEYIRDHVRLTTQPMEEPERPHQLQQMMEMVHADRTVMFSSDYPHWDGDDPKMALRHMDRDLKHRILAGTAGEVYGLTTKPSTEYAAHPVTRPRSGADQPLSAVE